MSLRARILLAFLAIVSLMVAVGVLSVRINARTQDEVARLRQVPMPDVESGSLLDAGVEIEGIWRADREFTAVQIERLPEARRPKLRGPVGGFDAAAHELRLAGVRIGLDDETQFVDVPTARGPEALASATRAEVSCKIDDDGRWIARKIRLQDV